MAMIFADIRLPGLMDGVQLAKAACTLWPTIRVVLTSSAAEDRLDDRPDCVTFLPKPLRGLDVLIQAEKAVRQPSPPFFPDEPHLTGEDTALGIMIHRAAVLAEGRCATARCG